MTTKPQTKFNAKRSAETAAKRTGIAHAITEVAGGWMVVACPRTAAKEVPGATSSLERYTNAVIAALESEGCQAAVADETEAQIMLRDGHANGRASMDTAGDILAWLEELEQEEDEALEAANGGTTASNLASDAAMAVEAAAVADALEAVTAPLARLTLPQASRTVLDAWTDVMNRQADMVAALTRPMKDLHAALAARSPRATTTAPRKPRTGTKQEAVLAMLRRPEGATVAQIAEATDWASHTVRGFLAGLKKKGIQVEVLERVRQVGPNKEGAKGSFSIYKVG